MASANDASIAMTNRALRNIKTELEYLTDLSVISPQQLQSILAQLPAQTPLHAPLASQPIASTTPATAPVPVAPLSQMSTLNLNEKATTPISYASPLPPPAYAAGPPVLGIASALYAYAPTDAGDLALQPNDRVQVIEHMNNDWWRGRNERTSLEGIFPRSYVTVIEEKVPVPPRQPTEYGNLPLATAYGSSSTNVEGKKPSKFEENGKKFGKKMGNAAIFGAGATIGSNIVNGIF